MGDIRGAGWPSDVECDPRRLRVMMYLLRDARVGARLHIHVRWIFCYVGNRTFVSISWMYKKQCAVSHSSAEAAVASLDSWSGQPFRKRSPILLLRRA